jgi:uncharacterized repeat protein (TIGR03803 family)
MGIDPTTWDLRQWLEKISLPRRIIMARKREDRITTFGTSSRSPVTVLIATLVVLAVIASEPAQAQTFRVLYSFTGGQDGAAPLDGLTIDRYGNLYGTASAGGYQMPGCNNGSYGNTGCGAVFELARSGSGWIFKPLFDFQGGYNSGNPGMGVVFGPGGALYGLTNGAGGCSNYYICGSVFRLRPPPTFCASVTCNWQETVLHQFIGQPDGSLPASRVLFDSAGNMYGVTFFGGAYNDGAVYQLAPGNGGWTESVIYSFNSVGGLGVALPGGPLAIDPAANLYGAADCNSTLGCFYGAVWQLQVLQDGWTLNELYQFNGYNGYEPVGVLRDSSGNLLGTTLGDGGGDSAAVYELGPYDGGWNYTQLYNYGGFGEDSTVALVMDSAGNLYGADSIVGNGYIFKLTRSGNGWTFSRLHSFSGPDGAGATGQLVLDSAGNLYGTTVRGGTYGDGVIWEITP